MSWQVLQRGGIYWRRKRTQAKKYSLERTKNSQPSQAAMSSCRPSSYLKKNMASMASKRKLTFPMDPKKMEEERE
jgi:hypothetical protein